jgi:hypothetical protein
MVDHLICKSYKYHRGAHTIAKRSVLEANTILSLFCHFHFARLCKTYIFSFNGKIVVLKFVVCLWRVTTTIGGHTSSLGNYLMSLFVN